MLAILLTALLSPPFTPELLLLLQQRTGSSSQPPHTCPACRPPGHFLPSPGHRELSNFSESLQLPLPLYIQHLLLLLLSHFSHVCDPTDGSPPGSTIPGVFQARTLEWVAISFSNAWKWKVKVKSLSRVQLLATPWTAAYQAPPSMGFSRQEYWSGLPLPSLSALTILY